MNIAEFKPALDSLILLAAALGGAVLIWKTIWLPIIKTSLKTKAFFKRLCEGLDKINVIDSRVQALELQFKRNGGSSIKDDLDGIKERIGSLENLVSAQMEDDPAAVFICSDSASNMFVNRTYCRMLGASRDELLSRGWENFIPNAAVAKYTALWTSAFETNREISTDLFMSKADGTVICTHLTLQPLSRQGDKARRFLGKIRVNKDCSREKCLVNEHCPIMGNMPHRP